MNKTRHRRIERLKQQERNRKYRKQRELFSSLSKLVDDFRKLFFKFWNNCVKTIKRFADSLSYIQV